MPLKSFLFKGNARLEKCLVSHAAHVKPGDSGPHVRDIQIALECLDELIIAPSEQEAMRYGPSTAAAVLAYKKKRKIINRSYQNAEDNIVGIMTMASLDQEMFNRQTRPEKPRRTICRNCGLTHAVEPRRFFATDSASLAQRWRSEVQWDNPIA